MHAEERQDLRCTYLGHHDLESQLYHYHYCYHHYYYHFCHCHCYFCSAEAPADDDLEEDDEVEDEEDDYEEEKPAAKKAKGAAGKAAGGKKGGQAAKGIIFMYFLLNQHKYVFSSVCNLSSVCFIKIQHKSKLVLLCFPLGRLRTGCWGETRLAMLASSSL